MISISSTRVRLSALALACLALAACGGGGGDSGTPATPAATPTPGYHVRALNFTDANNYILRYYFSSGAVDGSGTCTYYDKRVGRTGGVAMTNSALYDSALFASASGWLAFDGSTANSQTSDTPSISHYGGFVYSSTSVETDVSGQSIASVIALANDLAVNSVATLVGVNPTTSGTMPLGAKVRKVSSINTAAPVQYRVSDGVVPSVSTLAALVAAYPVPASPTAINTASMARLHSNGCGATLCPNEALRVAFGASNAASYYLCDYNSSSGAMSNCVAAGTGTYATSTAADGSTPIMTFAGLPAAAAAQTLTRVFVARNNAIYYGWQDKLRDVTTTRLNKVAFEALAAQLGIAAPALPSAYAGSWSASYAGGDTGSCVAVSVDEQGLVSGSCVSTGAGGSFTVAGQVSSTGAATFSTSSGANFNGTFTLTTASGSWTWPAHSVSGSWTATKH